MNAFYLDMTKLCASFRQKVQQENGDNRRTDLDVNEPLPSSRSSRLDVKYIIFQYKLNIINRYNV